MSSLGYRKAYIKYDTAVSVRKGQLRIRTDFHVETGIRFSIDTVLYYFNDTSLQQLADQKTDLAIQRKGAPFDYNLIDAEINRLTDLFQNNGFFKINK